MRNASKLVESYDHLGNKYPSKSAMCKAYGVSLSLYIKRMERHENNVKYALTGMLYADPLHPEIEYASASELCHAYKMPLKTYKRRKDLGWTDEEALTTPLEKPDVNPVCHEVTLEGVKYPSIRAACAAYGIKPHTYYARLRNGWQLPEAITTPVSVKTKHLGDKDKRLRSTAASGAGVNEKYQR